MDLKALTKEELVAEYNALAELHGRDLVEDFKTLGGGRTMLKGLIKATTPKPEKVKKERAQGVGAFAKEQLLAGVSNADTLAAVLEKFPDAKTTSSCIAYYKTKLIKAGLLVSSRKAKAEAPAEATE
jgi:hypothetical protein